MKNIEIKILNPEVIGDCERMMVFCARLTQRGHRLNAMCDVLDLYDKSYKPETIKTMTNLPHPTIQKFGVINVAVVGASRRFLAQITRHQNEVKFMSASLQYSDYSANNSFCVPYEITEKGPVYETAYINGCREAMDKYKVYSENCGNDAAGYLAPQGLRNVLIISATPYQWKHMIGQRICRRNTTETKYVMLKIWEQLYKQSPSLFDMAVTGAGCQRGKCLEGKMCCGKAIAKTMTPADILKEDFPLFYEEATI